ncbi:hypothetical protein NE237_032320 [Protea cynaroides]|uniref:RNase H type-1 domain-containing protein n=1 Tax=Protea cynaroides TaxID=273540 RepID=A0A9Q0L2U3_9MAGN|nr:hypothetical protein NE237_032320 [Protea cynaroides]
MPPPTNYFKLNIDAAMDATNHRAGIGVVLRNSLGFPVLACSIPSHFSDVLLGEALAVRAGLNLVLQYGYRNLVVESDCLELINLLTGPSNVAQTYVQDIVTDISVLGGQAQDLSFCFSPRSANSVAHSLARRAMTCSRAVIWPISSLWLIQLCNLDAVVAPVLSNE